MLTDLYSNAIYMLFTTLLFSIAFDLIIGEFPTKVHPVVWIGKLIEYFKNKFISINNRYSGLLLSICVIILSSLFVLPLVFIKEFLYLNDGMIYLFKLFAILLLSSTFSIKLLLNSANNVGKYLKNNNLNKARESVSYLVSRNTKNLNKDHIISSVIETLSENIIDSYVSPIFYYSIIGIILSFVGVNDFNVIILAILVTLIYRVSDTMDSMVGYKTEELSNIGYVPAKLDDVLNYVPARISGYLIIFSSAILKLNWKNAQFIMNRDAKNCESPNSGYTMAAMAGALNVQLEKEGYYKLGDSYNSLNVKCIEKAIDVSKLSISIISLFFIFIFLDIILILI